MQDKLDQRIQDQAQQVHDDNATSDQFAVSQTPYHTHNGADSSSVSFPNLINRSRFIVRQVIGPTTANTVASTVGGTFRFPFGGNFVNLYAYVETAGTTGSQTIDILLNGTSIIPSLPGLSIATGATKSNTILLFSKKNFSTGDLLTFNVGAIQTTPAQGLTMQLRVTETTP